MQTFYSINNNATRSLSPGRATFYRPSTSASATNAQSLTPAIEIYTPQEIKERLTVA